MSRVQWDIVDNHPVVMDVGIFPQWTMDNTRNHGLGSQQQQSPYEADANFGRVVNENNGRYEALVARIRESMKVDGFLNKRRIGFW
jgi:hypothetical protein